MYIEKLLSQYPILNSCSSEIYKTCSMLQEIFSQNQKLLIAGNGGSAADADHIAGELLKGFRLKRYYKQDELPTFPLLSPEESLLLKSHLQKGFPAIPLSSFSSYMTAYINDEHPDLIYAQLISILGQEGDVFLGITTSGQSKNIIYAASVAKSIGMKVICLIGNSKSILSDLADVVISVPEISTPDVQELHLPVYHALCSELEHRFYGE